jgi:hypothetical protein
MAIRKPARRTTKPRKRPVHGITRRRWWHHVDWRRLTEMHLPGRARRWWLAYEHLHDDATIFGPFLTRTAARAAEPAATRTMPEPGPHEGTTNRPISRIYLASAPARWSPARRDLGNPDVHAPPSADYEEIELPVRRRAPRRARANGAPPRDWLEYPTLQDIRDQGYTDGREAGLTPGAEPIDDPMEKLRTLLGRDPLDEERDHYKRSWAAGLREGERLLALERDLRRPTDVREVATMLSAMGMPVPKRGADIRRGARSAVSDGPRRRPR